MEIKKIRKEFVMAPVAILLLILAWLIYGGWYKKLPAGKEKEITIGVFSDSYWEVPNGYSYVILDEAIKIFEERHPGIRVTYKSGILKSDYSEWLAEQILSDTAPDLFFVLADDFNDLAEIGALKNLAPLIQRDQEFDGSVFYSSACEYGRHDQIPYALPFECAPKLMFVNRTILDRENISMPANDWTWDDLYDICRQVTKDTDGNGITDQFGVTGYTWLEAFESNGVRLFNEKGTACYFNEDQVERALDFMERLEKITVGYQAKEKDFDMGNVAFRPMLFSEYRAYKPYPLSIKKYSGFEWECMPMPAGPDGENISTLDTLLLAMNKRTGNEKYAWDFMKILTCDVRIQSMIFDYSEGVSVLKGVTESDGTLEKLMEDSGSENPLNLEILSNAVEHAVVVPRFRNYEEAVAEVDQGVNDILNGKMNIRMGQIIWNRKINQYLANR